MDVRCEKCSTEYEFDENRVGANGVTVKCTACGFVFKVRRPRKPPSRATTTLGKGPQGREWLVRKPDGQMIAFRELTTLQKWIVEGRINRDDEISKNGETWKRLGNILELEPFFSVYEKARALNDLMEKGGNESQRVQLRGSEVLATMDPLSQIPLESHSPGSTIPPIGPEIAHASSFSSTQRANITPAPPPPPPELAQAPVQTRPTSGARSNGFGGNGTGSMAARRTSTTPSQGMHMPGPAATLDSSPPPAHISRPPASWHGPGASLGITLEDTGSMRGDTVERFERSQKRKKVWTTVAVIGVVGLAGGAAFAKFGPTGNVLQQMASDWGLLTPKVQDDPSVRAPSISTPSHRSSARSRSSISRSRSARPTPSSARIARSS
jgi:predicted Zn finger-like uncharacterized protein